MEYLVHLSILFGIYAILSLGLNLIVGYTGLLSVAQAAFFPSVMLTGTGGFAATSITDWLQWPSRFWSVGPALAQTIFDAGLRRATVQQYQASFEQAVANHRETVLTAFQQVEDNLATLRILSEVIAQQDTAVMSAT